VNRLPKRTAPPLGFKDRWDILCDSKTNKTTGEQNSQNPVLKTQPMPQLLKKVNTTISFVGEKQFIDFL
jgi:hypothetical protein